MKPMMFLPLIPNTISQASSKRTIVHNESIIRPQEQFPLFEFMQVYFDANGRNSRIISTAFLGSGQFRVLALPGANYQSISYAANADLQYQLENLDLLKKGPIRTKLAIISPDNADNLYDWVINAISNTTWYNKNPARFQSTDLLKQLGIFLIPDPSIHLINELGLAKTAEDDQGLTTKRAHIELSNGIVMRVSCEQESESKYLEYDSHSDSDSVKNSEEVMESLRAVPETYALVPTTIANALDAEHTVTYNRRVIEAGMKLFDFSFKALHVEASGYTSIEDFSTKFLQHGRHCIITLPATQASSNQAIDPHLQNYIDNLRVLRTKFDKLVIVAKANANNLHQHVIRAIHNAPWFSIYMDGAFPNILQKLRIVTIADPKAALINALGLAADGKYGITAKRAVIIAADGVAKAVHYQNDPLIADRVQANDAMKVMNSLKLTPQKSTVLHAQRPQEKLVIVGGGIVGAIQALLAYLAAKKTGQRIRVTVYDKNTNIQQTTASNIAPSLTLDEMLSVIPFGDELIKALGISFEDLRGIKIDDIINNSPAAIRFKEQVLRDCKDEATYRARNNALLQLGRYSMDLWKEIYDSSDADLKQVFDESNFRPSYEPDTCDVDNGLNNGYRIDLIYDTENAQAKAESMRAEYIGVGYKKCRILTPDEAEEMDPSQKEFCAENSEQTEAGARVWKNNAVALYRPGGCLNAQKFLPKLYEYLQKVMGKYTNEHGEEKDCFRLKFRRKVDGIIYGTGLDTDDSDLIKGLSFEVDHLPQSKIKINDNKYSNTEYFFNTGENVGCLTKLGFIEPAYAAFGGASLKIKAKLSAELQLKYGDFSHCKEVHKPGVVLAWQANCEDGQFNVAVAGTKAFHGDGGPKKGDKFTQLRNLIQLNMVNRIFPDVLSELLGKNTKGQELMPEDLKFLVENKFADCWSGKRSVYSDCVPTFGPLHRSEDGVRARNAETANGLGSGGVSNAPITFLARERLRKAQLFTTKAPTEDLEARILGYTSSLRVSPSW